MNPDTGRFEPMETPEDLLRIRDVLRENAQGLQKAVDEAELSAGHPLVMTLQQRMKVLMGEGKLPVFEKGEFLVIRGVAFRIGHLTRNGMLLRPVRDQQLIDMVNQCKPSSE
jgi:hypothetical protein